MSKNRFRTKSVTRAARILAAVAFSTCVLTAEAQAGGILSGRVNEVVIGTDGGVLVNIDGSYDNRPTCSLGNTYSRMVIEAGLPGNRSVLAAVLLALHSGKGVTAVGTGQCNFEGGHEILSFIFAHP